MSRFTLPDQPLVSVLTTCRNSRVFIERCIESVLGQDYPNVEYIVQDGASDDGTLDILKRYSGRIDWVSEPDEGQADGLNRALQRCRGDIIAVLNSDDEYYPHALSWAVEQMRRHPDMAVIYGQTDNVDAQGKLITRSEGPDPYWYDRIFCCEDVIPAQAAFVRRECLQLAGYYVDATLQTCPDFEWWVRIGLDFKMKYVPGVVARYRWHPGSEGLRDDVIYKAVDTKTEIIERVCWDPTTPKWVRNLERRAKGGILYWSAFHFVPPIQHGKEHLAVAQRQKGTELYGYPSSYFKANEMLTGIRIFGFAKYLRAIWQHYQIFYVIGVSIRVFRENVRRVDREMTGGRVYKFLYLPLKGILKCFRS